MAMASAGMGVACVGLGRAGVYTIGLVAPARPPGKPAAHFLNLFLGLGQQLPPRPDYDDNYDYGYYNYNDSCCY